jgi:hypothetical protein
MVTKEQRLRPISQQLNEFEQRMVVKIIFSGGLCGPGNRFHQQA